MTQSIIQHMRKVESRQQGPSAKKNETGRGIGGAL